MLVDPDARRFDVICRGIDLQMENKAHMCPELESGLRLARAIEPGGDKMIRAFFTINPDTDQVHAWWVERVEADEDAAS